MESLWAHRTPSKPWPVSLGSFSKTPQSGSSDWELLFPVLEAGRLQRKCLQGTVVLRPVSWVCRSRLLPVSPRGRPSVQVCVLSSFYKDIGSMGSGPTPGTLFYLPHLSEDPSPNTVTFCPQPPTLPASASKGMTLFCHVNFDFQVFGTSAPSCSALNQSKAHVGPQNCTWWNWRKGAVMFFSPFLLCFSRHQLLKVWIYDKTHFQLWETGRVRVASLWFSLYI